MYLTIGILFGVGVSFRVHARRDVADLNLTWYAVYFLLAVLLWPLVLVKYTDKLADFLLEQSGRYADPPEETDAGEGTRPPGS